jgi:hypothetical protein
LIVGREGTPTTSYQVAFTQPQPLGYQFLNVSAPKVECLSNFLGIRARRHPRGHGSSVGQFELSNQVATCRGQQTVRHWTCGGKLALRSQSNGARNLQARLRLVRFRHGQQVAQHGVNSSNTTPVTVPEMASESQRVSVGTQRIHPDLAP